MNVTPREEYAPLTPHQLQVLLALAIKPQSGYDLTRQTGLAFDANPGRQPRIYTLTDNGRLVLGWEVDRLRVVVHLGYERPDKPKKELESSFFAGFAREN